MSKEKQLRKSWLTKNALNDFVGKQSKAAFQDAFQITYLDVKTYNFLCTTTTLSLSRLSTVKDQTFELTLL